MTGRIRPSIESFGYGPGRRSAGSRSAAASSSNIPVEKKKLMNGRIQGGYGLTYRNRLAHLSGNQVVHHRYDNDDGDQNKHNDDEQEVPSWSLDNKDLPMDAFGEGSPNLSVFSLSL